MARLSNTYCLMLVMLMMALHCSVSYEVGIAPTIRKASGDPEANDNPPYRQGLTSLERKMSVIADFHDDISDDPEVKQIMTAGPDEPDIQSDVQYEHGVNSPHQRDSDEQMYSDYQGADPTKQAVTNKSDEQWIRQAKRNNSDEQWTKQAKRSSLGERRTRQAKRNNPDEQRIKQAKRSNFGKRRVRQAKRNNPDEQQIKQAKRSSLGKRQTRQAKRNNPDEQRMKQAKRNKRSLTVREEMMLVPERKFEATTFYSLLQNKANVKSVNEENLKSFGISGDKGINSVAGNTDHLYWVTWCLCCGFTEGYKLLH